MRNMDQERSGLVEMVKFTFLVLLQEYDECAREVYKAGDRKRNYPHAPSKFRPCAEDLSLGMMWPLSLSV